MVGDIERNFFFKVARGFSWLIVIIASISLITSIIYLINTLPMLYGGGTEVSKEEISIALAEKKGGGKYQADTYSNSSVNIDLINKLNSETTKIVLLFPEDVQKKLGEKDIESMRKHINGKLSFWDNIEDRISTVKHLRSELEGFSDDTEKMKAAVDKYIDLKIEKERILKSKKSESLIKVGSAAGGILTMLVLITLVTLILVLMAIERNTRKITE